MMRLLCQWKVRKFHTIRGLERGLAMIHAEARIDAKRLEAAHKEGLAMTLEQAIAYALQLN
jgi:hypothetical protein